MRQNQADSEHSVQSKCAGDQSPRGSERRLMHRAELRPLASHPSIEYKRSTGSLNFPNSGFPKMIPNNFILYFLSSKAILAPLYIGGYLLLMVSAQGPSGPTASFSPFA